MKIVYLLGVFEPFGGQELYLARQQARQGHEVTVVTSDRFYPLPNIRERYVLEGLASEMLNRSAGRTRHDGVTIIRLPTRFRYQDFYWVKGIASTLRELQPDVVFGHEPRTIVPFFGAVEKDRLGYVYFVDVHDFFHRVQNHAWWQRALRYAEYFWWRKWFVRYAFSKADCIIAVADECKKFIHQRHGVALDRIRDLPLGVDTDYFQHSDEGREKRRAELNIGERDIVLVFSGYMFRRKALETLIDVVAELQGRIRMKILFVGEIADDYQRELTTRAKNSGVASSIIFYGFASRATMSELYSASDIAVWPGNNTLAILEAMACGLPLVIADMQLAHLAKHGNGILVPYADVQALTLAIESLATDNERRARMGKESLRAVHELYGYDKLASTVTVWMEEAVRKNVSRRKLRPVKPTP